MRILALDLGTWTGWALGNAENIQIGTWKLATPREIRAWGTTRLTRRKDPRVRRLCDLISALGSFDVVIYEDVQFSTTTLATQMWAALRSSVWLCCPAAHFEAVPVATLKKFATGNGAATKDMMAASLKKEHPELHALCDSEDAVDATHLLLWARKNLQRINSNPTI